MSRMYSDGDYEKELKEMHKSVMSSIRDFDRQKKRVLKDISVPMWIKQGEALVREDKMGAWKRFVKSEGKVRNVYGAAVEQSLEVMRALETEGMEKALETFKHLDGQWYEVMKVVSSYSRHGVAFVNAWCEKNPVWLENFPKLANFKEKSDQVITPEENERINERINEALEYMKNVSKLELPSAEASKLKYAITDFEKISKSRNSIKTSSTKR